jgi:tRNA1Val (adenine37-N6)-methyltransferase
MANDFFRFKQFTIHQSLCGMKVGTDGTLLGAWANGGRHILDIGTGTGLIALMMAQRFPEASVVGVDIDVDACIQARRNADDSPFCHRISVCCLDVCELEPKECYDAIVSNPPYFEHSLVSPDAKRTLARHAFTLTYADLMNHAWRLLSDNGELSVVIPAEGKAKLEAEAALIGFFKSRECAVRTTPMKMPRRFLLAFKKHPSPSVEATEGVIETAPNVRSEWYRQLTQDFYLK